MKNILSIFSFILFSTTYSQITVIDVADLTVKVGGVSSEVLYYGFSEGDQIIFNFEEINGKPLKEIEIMEMPSNSKFADFKSTLITDKVIQVHKTGVYGFGFRNSAMKGRICKIKIQRIPKSEDLIAFNTNWEWKTLYDTSYVPYTKDSLVGYDTTYSNQTKRELVRVDTLVTELFNKVERVHSKTNLNGHTAIADLNVYLPQNTAKPNVFLPYETTKVIAWSYWIGVGQKSTEEYNAANKNMSKGIAALGALTGYGALASLAITGISLFGTPSSGDNVGYKLKYLKDGMVTTFDFGNGVSAAARNTDLLQGGFTIELYNDNTFDAIDVTVKMACVQLRKTWDDIPYKMMHVKPRYMTLNKQRMVVKTSKIRINSF
ncbi:MAG: hypothetical protein ACI8ZM_001805 [Crocinitomix sp.]|jgi:hypothetical protein